MELVMEREGSRKGFGGVIREAAQWQISRGRPGGVLRSTTTISCLTGKQPVGFGCEVVRRRRRRRRTETRSGHGAPTLDLMSWALLRAARDLKSNRFDMLSQAIRPVLVDWHNNRHSTRTHRED
ncbi:hypothetical protein U9M48_042980 [Paspalum notatum var. saurae]|uniref:Uncharacterized protein n=1 Tax=Paspalum notatum var. saurae TaxID=547442 RepID=A0AAQ3UWG3_PASNO